MDSSDNSSVEGETNFAGASIRDFLEHYLGVYCNPNGVVMTMLCDDSISVASTFYRTVAHGMHTVGVSHESENMRCFLDTFSLNAVADLDGITILSLMSLFQQGRAELYCSLETQDDMLHFRKQYDRLYARDDLDVEHAVSIELKSAEAIIWYTKQYFEGK